MMLPRGLDPVGGDEVLTVETWQEVRRLAAQGWSIRRIAREKCLSRNTVAKAIAAEKPPAYERRVDDDPLAPWQEHLERGVRQGLRGSRLLQEIRQKGYSGYRASFYRRLQVITEAQRPPVAVLRFETDPGEQAQFDWATYSVCIAEQLIRVHVHSLVYCYSRRLHWHPSLSCKQPALFEALETSFRLFGGVCRELVIDNPRAFVDYHARGERRFNREFLAFCGHYRIHPIAARPRNPQTKGKVENGFDHLEQLFLKCRSWASWESFEQDLAAFELDWNQRLHGTTKLRPAERFHEERLQPLPRAPYFGVGESFRQVSRDCLISVGGVMYSVPAPFVGKSVIVRLQQGRVILVYSQQGSEIARHVMRPSGSPPVICSEHYETLRRRHCGSIAVLAEQFRGRYCGQAPAAEAFLQRLLAQERYRPAEALQRVLDLLSAAPETAALAALADAVEFNTCTPRFIQSRLQHRLQGGGSGSLQIPLLPSSGQLTLPELDVERSLDVYRSALDEPSAPGRLEQSEE